MAALSSQYLRRRRAVQKEAELQEAASFASVMLNADPGNRELDRELTQAAEELLRVREKIEYLDALIDSQRAPRWRTRPAGAPTPTQLLLIQQKAQLDRAAAQRARLGIPAEVVKPARRRRTKPKMETTDRVVSTVDHETPEVIEFLTPEQAQADSWARHGKADDREARRALRKLKAAAHAREMRALKKQAAQP